MDNQYYITESDLAKLFNQSGLPANFRYQFVRDYVALKRDLNGAGTDIESLDARLTTAEANIQSLTISYANLTSTVSDIENDLAALTVSFNSHVTTTSAHGASGNIVGTDNYCTLTLGGTVKLAAAVTNQTSSTVNVTTLPNAAGVAYLQSDAATWVTMLNDLKTQLNTLVADHNAVVTKINSMLSSERTALQRAP